MLRSLLRWLPLAAVFAPLFAAAEPAWDECAPLPEAGPRIEAALQEAPGEGERATALLFLPGSVSEPATLLAEGVEVVSSFWSPLLCASVTQLQGPAGVAPAAWVVKELPEEGALLPDDTYFTQQQEPAPEPAETGEDPYRPLQYALDELGVEAARGVTRGEGTRIAVLDSMPELDHPDLGDVSVPARFAPDTPAAHGTQIVGLLAAKTDNGLGIEGLVPGAEVLAIPVCTPLGDAGGDRCSLGQVLQGLDAAWEGRAHIVNLSLAGPSNPLLQGAADRLEALGVTLVAAAGNDGARAPLYPAAYASVVGVGASNRAGEAWTKSNRSAGSELTAPGVDVVSTTRGGGFEFANGTSLATAHVSGVLALVASASGDLAAARRAVFGAARRHPRATAERAVLAPVCTALAEVGRPCDPVR